MPAAARKARSRVVGHHPRVIAVALGAVAALMWGGSTVCSTRSSKLIGARAAVGWVMLIGLVVTLPIAAVIGVPARLDGRSLAILIGAGALTVIGLLLDYAGLELGQVSLVAPVVSTEGAIAALIAIGAGERLTTAAAILLVFIVIGVFLAGLGGDAPSRADRDTRRSVVLAGLAAVAFGISLYTSGDLGRRVGPLWVVFIARVAGVVMLAGPLALRGRLTITRPLVPLLLAAGLGEVVGYLAFVEGARHDLAVTAVVASQFATVAALGGAFFYGERLARRQVIGVVVTLAGVAALSAVRAS
jgi:drug/metabolite transporter (DMT)-like permease